MFAKANWFRPALRGLVVQPASAQGWTYTIAAAATALLPAAVLVGRGQGWEALTWFAATTGFASYDIWQARRPAPPPKRVETATVVPPVATAAQDTADDGIYFVDNTGKQPVNTTRFQLSLKR